jgi:hypothetical protein
MQRRNPWTRAILCALLLVVASAGNCSNIGDPGASTNPPKPVAGKWAGELFGVRFKLTLTESGTPDKIFNSTVVGGNGWLVYGTAPAESVAVALQGSNSGGEFKGVAIEFQRPNGAGGVYGEYSGILQEDGTMVGPFERRVSLEPTPSPWTAHWPAGTTAGSLRLTRQ